MVPFEELDFFFTVFISLNTSGFTRDEYNMKMWKTILLAISVAILPLALVGVGQAQQLNCWGLRPNLPERTDKTDSLEHQPSQDAEDALEREDDIARRVEDENDTKDTDVG